MPRDTPTSATTTHTCCSCPSSTSQNGPSSIKSQSQAQELDTLLSALTSMLVTYVDQNHSPTTPVLRYTPPHDLAARLQLTFSPTPSSLADILAMFQRTLDYSVRTGHPLFLDKLYTGVTPIGIATELLTGALNINTHVFQASPVGTLMEMACLAELRRLIGYPVQGGSGLMSPGGSMSNLIAMVTARNHKFPKVKSHGLVGMPPWPAMVIGLGKRQVFKVRTTENGCMIPEDLEKQIEDAKARGYLPFFVNATAGTTVLCSFDPIRAIAAITKRHNLWLHVDGSWGGSVLFSSQHKDLLDGVHLSDSFVVNPHKMLGVPLQCSCLLVAHPPKTMAKANSSKAGYLYHSLPAGLHHHHHPTHHAQAKDDAADDGNDTDSSATSGSDSDHDDDDDNDSGMPCMSASMADGDTDDLVYDLGNLGIGCGRRADGVKLYLSWKYEGTDGYAARVDRAFAMASTLRAKIRALQPALLPIFAREGKAQVGEHGANVCFWYVPRAWQAQWTPDEMRAKMRADKKMARAMAGVTAAMRVRMLHRGVAMVDYAPLPEPHPLPSFFRVPMNAPTVQEEHLDRLLAEIVEVGRQVERDMGLEVGEVEIEVKG
ncbi:pyridoxal phosphate-dependent transferase [Catenaria anguillulae PL171]|uniref:Pyridoxal phosphate-dependent transferase n=1 Tax=Catenaria anguillulae PL171 TaxID=765915 RepID=A0A1Y2HBY2_9FUNG|nr:pyridoxal phosphate-dependent transferase [Catenaria anguillulae PL171]